MTEPFIQALNVGKTYGQDRILERVNATVHQGEFITLVGASGCGKSTFLKMILGIEQPSSGELLLNGAPMPNEPGPDRGIVFQQYSVFPHMTVLENVVAAKGFQKASLSGYLFGKEKRQARQEASEILHQVGLGHALTRYPHELSGGMKQRLAIAQAVIGKPKILLLDEPFGALDPGIRADMHALILDVWRQHKLTIFMVTHDLKEGFYLGTRLWVFDKLRHDPHAPNAYGASITYDLPVGATADDLYREIDEQIRPTPIFNHHSELTETP
ncbi:ABC transporter ATP-binding protein [Maribrevibacterium harenarium]|uniref:ABC transporter ATP-binding protein n=1 Tax=Maribrevibacterium harenarium TaxID=2589817 RepID=A0A501WFQ2_9GAMM|nr:ABC transporter ATP-binding protein [Maribrevibacterium harenarium]TPE47190.1 ABC transporter ATP-binding protein [Maribrevibacterium harenarium]